MVTQLTTQKLTRNMRCSIVIVNLIDVGVTQARGHVVWVTCLTRGGRLDIAVPARMLVIAGRMGTWRSRVGLNRTVGWVGVAQC